MITAILAISLVLNIIILWWVYQDSDQRGMDPCAWALMICLCWPIGLIAYLISRQNFEVGQNPQYGRRTGPYIQQGQGRQNFRNPPRGTQGHPPGTFPDREQYGVPRNQSSRVFNGGHYDQTTRSPPPRREEHIKPPRRNIENMAPPSEYGQTEIHFSKDKDTKHDSNQFKNCKFCGSPAKRDLKFCPICGGNEFH